MQTQNWPLSHRVLATETWSCVWLLCLLWRHVYLWSSFRGSSWGTNFSLSCFHQASSSPALPGPRITWVRTVCWELASPTPTHHDGAQKGRRPLWNLEVYWSLEAGGKERREPQHGLSSEVSLNLLQGHREMNRDSYLEPRWGILGLSFDSINQAIIGLIKCRFEGLWTLNEICEWIVHFLKIEVWYL